MKWLPISLLLRRRRRLRRGRRRRLIYFFRLVNKTTLTCRDEIFQF